MKLITLVNEYIAYRRSFGEKMYMNEIYLKLFCKIVGNNISIKKVSKKDINDFLYDKRKSMATWFSKYSILNGLYRYAISRGYVSISSLPINLPKRTSTFTPYIYTRRELRKIFSASLKYKKRSQGHVIPYVGRIVLILLYGTGLRLNEALSLTMHDVDLHESILRVRETKFNKTRLVPFSKQLRKLLIDYYDWRTKNKYPKNQESPFFINEKCTKLTSSAVQFIFRRIRELTKICRKDGVTCQPRIHDLRHTFAVHRLTSWYQENADVQKLLNVLSIYLGHVKLEDTAIYLTVTPDILRQANIRFEQYAMGDTI